MWNEEASDMGGTGVMEGAKADVVEVEVLGDDWVLAVGTFASARRALWFGL